MLLDSPTCFKQLQHLEQEGPVQPDLGNFGKKICIYGHTEYKVIVHVMNVERFSPLCACANTSREWTGIY